MARSCLVVLSVAVLLSAISLTRADLPVHCEVSHAIGEWVFSVSASNLATTLPQCGGFAVQTSMKLTLQHPNVVVDSAGQKGTFTTIYDEGMEVRIHGRKYFAFFKHTVDLQTHGMFRHRSYCHKTETGTFHNNDRSNWGCFSAQKVTQPDMLISVSADGKENWHLCGRGNGQVDCSAASAPSNLQSELQEASLMALMLSGDLPVPQDSETFSHSDSMISEINELGLSWKAASYPEFQGKSIGDMRTLLGSSPARAFAGDSDIEDLQGTQTQTLDELLKNMPKSWDWRNVDGVNYMFEVSNQGSCGSCFAVSTVDMIQTRIAIATKNAVRNRLSVQDILECGTVYTQACNGGFPYLASKFTQDFGLGLNSENEYSPGQIRVKRQQFRFGG